MSEGQAETRGWVALVDLLEGGHHSTYLILFARALLRLGCRVVVVCPQPQAIFDGVRGDESIDYFEDKADRLRGIAAAPPAPSQFPVGRLRSRFDAIARWQLTNRLLQEWEKTKGNRLDLIILPYLDAYLSPYLLAQEVDRCFTFPWVGLYMKPKHLRLQPQMSRLRRYLLGRAELLRSHYCQGVATLDGGVLNSLQAEARDAPVILFPDLADPTDPQINYGPARAIAEQAQERTVVGMIGSLDRRKGLRTLLEVAHQASSEPYFFATVGKLSGSEFNPIELKAVLTAIEAKPSNCFFHLESMPGEAEFNAVINSFDIVFAAYLQFPCSSNMLAKAALFRKPIIVSDGFYMAEQVRRYHLGVVVPEDDPVACLKAIHNLTHLPAADQAQMAQGRAHYLQDNSYDQLVQGLGTWVRYATDSAMVV